MQKHPNVRYAVISLLFLIPFVSLIVSTSLFFPYITGKNLFFRLLIEIAFVFYVLLALRVPAYRPKLGSILVSFAAFIVIIFAADVFGEFPFKSFWSNYERMEGFITHLHLFAYFIMLSAVFTGEKMWTYFFHTSLGASIIMGFFALDPEKQQGGRLFSQVGNSSYLGIYMLFHMFIASFLLVRLIERKGETSYKWMIGSIYGLIILFNFFIFYNTGTRGALLGLLAGALFTSLAFAIWEKNRSLKILGISVLVGIALVVGSLAVFKDSPFIKDRPLLTRFASLATFDREELAKFATTQGKSRFGIWGIAYEGFKERPMLGWGQDNFNYVFNKYYDPKIYDQEQWFDRAHNVFFDWLIAGGILGLLSYLGLFVTAIIAIWRSKVHDKNLFFLFSDKVLLTALLIAYFIHNLFVFDSISSYILFFGILAFISIHEGTPISAPNFFKSLKENSIMAGSIIAVLMGGVSLYYFTFAPYVSGKTLISALSYQAYALNNSNDQAFTSALDSYSKAFAKDKTVGIFEAREQLLQSASTIVFEPSVSDNVRASYFSASQEEMKKTFDTVPPDTRYYMFYGSFLTKVGKAASSTEIYNEGMQHILKAVELSPRKQTTLFEAGAMYINNDQFKEAVPYFKKAFEGEPDFVDARFLYALSLIYIRDNVTADELLKPLSSTPYLGDYRLINAYYDTKQNKRVETALRYKLTYADALVKAGDKAGAVSQLEEIISLSPTYKAEAEKRLLELKKQ